ncbi:MAG: 2Fe-2S iron-sulfur cluster-binding protein, partial [Kineosporiaceae bacterium]
MLKKPLIINGQPRTVLVAPDSTLGDVVRKQLHLTGTKLHCSDGHCGACNVLVDGKLVISCMTKITDVADGAAVVTVEGIGTPHQLDPIQLALVATGAP